MDRALERDFLNNATPKANLISECWQKMAT